MRTHASRCARWLLLALALTSGVPAPGRAADASFDVLRYTFGLTLEDETDLIDGEASLVLRLGDPTTSSVELDFVGRQESGHGMTVLEVTDGEGVALPFDHRGDRLRITLDPVAPEGLTQGSLRHVVVRYSGVPAGGLRIDRNRYGERTFFSDNWPQGARHWLPTVDHPADKAHCAFVVTAPAHYQVVANGRLVEEVDLPGDLRRTRWQTEAPIATKVMALGVARFAVHHYGEVGGIPVQGWLFLADREAGLGELGRARAMVAFFAERLGPFPFAKLATVQSTTHFGGMENASAIFLGQGRIGDPELLEGLLAHEVAHQWFGDALTESDWNELWLSEGFATYFGTLYLEAAHGRHRLEEEMAGARRRVLAWTQEHPGAVVRPPAPLDPMELLNTNTYQKGAWILHMLRQEVGDEIFWQAMSSYYLRHRDGTVGTDDVERVVEELAGRDLGWFFRQWLESPGHPVLAVDSRFDPAAGALDVEVRQVQAEPPFRGRLVLEADGPDGATASLVVELRDRQAHGRFELAFTPVAVEVDPRVELLYDAANEGQPVFVPTP